MSGDYHRILLLFVDGVGLAEGDSANVFARASAPTTRGILDGPLTIEQCGAGADWMLAGLDATLGVPGRPQSATGQATLFTGVNAALGMGRHVSGFPGPRLRSLISGRGLWERAHRAGIAATFANAYTAGYLDKLERGQARPSVTTCLVQDAGLRFRNTEDLDDGRAVTWDVVGDVFGRGSETGAAAVTPVDAGRRLAALSGRYQLTVFETFLPDLVAHSRVDLDPEDVVERLDGLLGGILEARQEGLTVVMTSDHGNLESTVDRAHTLNPVPLLAVGPAARRFKEATSIIDITPAILEILSGTSRGASS